jgi:hypothetical protein
MWLIPTPCARRWIPYQGWAEVMLPPVTLLKKTYCGASYLVLSKWKEYENQGLAELKLRC